MISTFLQTTPQMREIILDISKIKAEEVIGNLQTLGLMENGKIKNGYHIKLIGDPINSSDSQKLEQFMRSLVDLYVKKVANSKIEWVLGKTGLSISMSNPLLLTLKKYEIFRISTTKSGANTLILAAGFVTKNILMNVFHWKELTKNAYIQLLSASDQQLNSLTAEDVNEYLNFVFLNGQENLWKEILNSALLQAPEGFSMRQLVLSQELATAQANILDVSRLDSISQGGSLRYEETAVIGNSAVIVVEKI